MPAAEHDERATSQQPPRRLTPIPGLSAKLRTEELDPKPEPETEQDLPEPQPEAGGVARLLAGVRGVDDDGNAAPAWGWDWCAIFPPEGGNVFGSRVLSERRQFVQLLRRAELTVKTIKRFGGAGRTFVLIGCREGRLKEEADRIKLRVRQSAQYGSDRLMPYAVFRTSEPPERYERFFEKKCFFETYHRKLLIESIISTPGYLTNDRTAGLRIDRLMQHGKLQEFFPLHESRKLEKLKALNETRCVRCRCFRSSGRQPLDLLRSYLGDPWAMYFAWLELYTDLLLVPSLAGCGVFIYTLLHADLETERQGALDSIWSLGYSFFLCGWGCVWRDLWKRKNAALVYRWGTKGVQRAERVRADFLGHEDGHLSLKVPPERSSGDGQISVIPAKPIPFGRHSTLVFSARWEPSCDTGCSFVRLLVTVHVTNRKGASEYKHEESRLDNVVHKEGDLVRVSTTKGAPDNELYRVASEMQQDEDGKQSLVFHLKPTIHTPGVNTADHDDATATPPPEKSRTPIGGEMTPMKRENTVGLSTVKSRLASIHHLSMIVKGGQELIPTLSRECKVGQDWATFTIVDRTIAEAQSIKVKKISISVVGAGTDGGSLQFASMSVRQAKTFDMDHRLGTRKLQKARKYVRLLHGRPGAKGVWTVPTGWSAPVWKAADAGWYWYVAGGLVLGLCCGIPVAYYLKVKHDLQLVVAVCAGIIVCIVVLFGVLYVRMMCSYARKVDDASDVKGSSDSLYHARRFGIYSGSSFVELEEFHEFFSDAYAAFRGNRSRVLEEHHQPPFYPRDFGSWFGWTHFVTRTFPKQVTVAVFVLLVTIGTLLLLILKDYLRKQYPQSLMATYGGPAVSALFILVMDNVWKVVARRLTDLENHRTDTEYTSSMIKTTFAFQFVSNYLSLFYIAFIKGYLTTFDKYLPFEPAPCDCSSELVGDTVLCCRAELYAQLVSLVVLRQAYGNIKEVLLPWIAHKCSQRSLARQNKSQEAEARANDTVPIKGNQVAPGDAANTGDESDNTGGNKLKHLIKEEQESAIVGPVKQSTMKRHDSCMATFDEYNEMVIQFGYIVLFGMIFPLAPAMSLLNNIIEQWSDTWKLLNTMQRPRPQLVERIGAWEPIIDFLCYVAILTNSFLVAFSSYQLENNWLTERETSWTMAEKLLACCIMEHLLLIWKWLIEAVIPDAPEWVTKAEARDDWIATEEQRFLSSRTVDSFEIGDHVRITKRGSKFGQSATVVDPDWAGRVKVQLQKAARASVDGHRQDDGVRSYYRDELERLENYERDSNEDASKSEDGAKNRSLVVHPLGLCTDGFAACDSVGRFCGGPFVGTNFKDLKTADGEQSRDKNCLVLRIDGETQSVALDGHDLSSVDVTAKFLDSALTGATVITSCTESFESLVITSANYKHSDSARVEVNCKASSQLSMGLLGIAPARFEGGTFIPHDFRENDAGNGNEAKTGNLQQPAQLVVCIDGAEPQSVELHADCTDIADAARVLNNALQPSATVSHRKFNITITSNALEKGGSAGSVEIDRIGSSTDAKRLLGLLDSCSHCGAHPANHAAPDRPDEDHNVVERAPDSAAKGDNEREGNVGNASGDSQPQSGHCAHCGSHPHHHRPRHMFHGIHRYR